MKRTVFFLLLVVLIPKFLAAEIYECDGVYKDAPCREAKIITKNKEKSHFYLNDRKIDKKSKYRRKYVKTGEVPVVLLLLASFLLLFILTLAVITAHTYLTLLWYKVKRSKFLEELGGKYKVSFFGLNQNNITPLVVAFKHEGYDIKLSSFKLINGLDIYALTFQCFFNLSDFNICYLGSKQREISAENFKLKTKNDLLEEALLRTSGALDELKKLFTDCKCTELSVKERNHMLEVCIRLHRFKMKTSDEEVSEVKRIKRAVSLVHLILKQAR